MGRDFGKASVNRERNMTMNCTKFALAMKLAHNDAFSTCKAFDNATIDSCTYCNVWIICEDIFMRRAGLALSRRW